MISVLILTYNEEKNMDQCLSNLIDFTDDIHVLDSYSEDDTIKITEEYISKDLIHFRKFDNYSKQRNWGLKNITFKYEWLLMLDADEILTSEVKKSIEILTTNASESIIGFTGKYRLFFVNKYLRFRLWPFQKNILFRHKEIEFERDINEHVVNRNELRTTWGTLDGFLLHKDNKTIHDYLAKHNHYSTMEAFRISEEKNEKIHWNRLNEMVEIKKIFYRLPFRNFAYFCYLYIYKMGFLDGKMGFKFIMTRVQYQMEIDLKMREIKSRQIKQEDYISFKK